MSSPPRSAGDKLDPRLPSPVEELRDERLGGVRLCLKRDDLIHPELPGNKWRKLKYNLHAAREQGHDTLLTFGGAYSNHIRATAAAGYYFGFTTIGVIRGEERLPLNASLAYAVRRGMRLTYLDRSTYRNKCEPDVVSELQRTWGRCYLVPEGGSNAAAVRGCAELPAEIEQDFDLICCPVGTGGTLAGIANGLAPGQRALGFAALNGDFLTGDIHRLGAAKNNWSINTTFHFGGFAKRTPALDAFIADFAERHGVELEWVHVAKMMYGIVELAQRNAFAPGARIIAVITGPADAGLTGP